MLILALDTTTPSGSVAVVRDDHVLALVHGNPSRTHGERLPAEIDRALAAADVGREAIDLLAVASGPGAFTGLRIGLAAMQGLALVLGKPVIGISALDALADTVWSSKTATRHVVTWMDAQRGEVFAAAYSGPDTPLAAAPMVGSPSAALATLRFAPSQAVWFVGDGALRYQEAIRSAWGEHARFVAPTPPLAPAVARLAVARAAQGSAGPPHALQPLYVRRPDAELDRDRQAGA